MGGVQAGLLRATVAAVLSKRWLQADSFPAAAQILPQSDLWRISRYFDHNGVLGDSILAIMAELRRNYGVFDTI